MSRASRRAFLAASICLIATSFAGAQAIKKYVTPDGRVIYSDVPIEGAREVGRVEPAPEVDPEARQEAEDVARARADQAQSAVQRSQDAIARQEQIRQAERRLAEAKATLENGKEPLPGERIGTAGGASRLTEAYFQRQAANERAVEKAQKDLDAVLAGRE
ncbi:MAG: DUF4124 domain-containing protein [Betaproteobacteria bacterium]|nr:MAG: DUF4124 domain-containing protein [Betaproteobacteria bacterium]